MSVAIITPKIGKAILASTNRGNRKNAEPNKLYDNAIEQFEASPQWSNGKTIDLLNGWLRGKPATVFLKNQSGFISLFLIVNGRSQYQSQYLVGYLDPSTGWQRARECSLPSFNIWHNRAKAEITRLEDRGRI